MRNYSFSSSKEVIYYNTLFIITFDIIFGWFIFQNEFNLITNDSVNAFIFGLRKIFIGSLFTFFAVCSIKNTIFFLKLDPHAKLEINNEENYLLYINIVDGVKKEVKVDFTDIYLIQWNKARLDNLSYYFIFYKKNEVIKKIVVSNTLTTKLEKKIDKQIEIVKVEKLYFEEFPVTDY